MSDREKFDSIREYCEQSAINIAELKENIIDCATQIGACYGANLEDYQLAARQTFYVLYLFNSILNEVK